MAMKPKNIAHSQPKRNLIIPTGFVLLAIAVVVSAFLPVQKNASPIPALPQANSIWITRGKKVLLPVILPENNTPYMKEAAMDLILYIEKISGARPELIIGTPNPLPQKAIWVGYQPVVTKFFPNVSFQYQHPEEVINAANENHIIISGRDRWNPEHMTIPDRTGKKMLTGIQQEYGTNNAVYTFIQNQLGVRWFWPGETGEDFEKTDAIEIKPFVYRHHPTIRDRGGMLHLLRLVSNKGGSEEHKWAKFQRMQLGSLDINFSHYFHNWWEKYGQHHPEYFAMLPNGKREPKFGANRVKICQSNPAVWATWLKEVEQQIKDNPNVTNFSAAPNDGWSDGHCTCEKCRNWDAPGFSWSNPNLSDREIRFVNTLAKLLKEKYPNKDYRVTTIAYGYTRPKPIREKPADNVIITGVFNALQRGDGFEDERSLALSQYKDWSTLTKNLSFRPNIGNPAGQIAGMPDVAPRQLAADLRLAQQYGCLGLFFDAYWNHWSNQGILYYTMAQCAWNPMLNIDSLLTDYHTRAYGPAKQEMKQYWEFMERSRNELISKVKTRHRFLRANEVYTPQWFEQANTLLLNAEKKAATGEKKYLERVQFAMAGFAFSKLVIETRLLNQAWEKNKEDKNLMAAIDNAWEKGKRMKATFPKYAINFNKVFNNPKASGLAGMHYLNPVNDKQLRRTENIPGYE